MFDSHCHLTDIEGPEQVLREALGVGLRSLLTVGYHAESCRAVIALRGRVEGLPVGLGLHPWFADEELEPIVCMIRQALPVAVGEVGLDLGRGADLPPLARQLEVLEPQLELATDLGLPVTMHSRKAVAELWSVVKGFPGLRGALHAFGGSLEQARQFVERGFMIGIGGAVTRSRAERIRRIARCLPLESLLVETDAPAIGMDTVEPPNVRPSHLRRVIEALAELRGQSFEEVEGVTDDNAMRLFGPGATVDLRPLLLASGGPGPAGSSG